MFIKVVSLAGTDFTVWILEVHGLRVYVLIPPENRLKTNVNLISTMAYLRVLRTGLLQALLCKTRLATQIIKVFLDIHFLFSEAHCQNNQTAT